LAKKPEPPGCRSAAVATGILIAVCLAFIGIGIPLVTSPDCLDACRVASETILFAATPISAIFNMVFGGDLVVAWPLEITFWVVVGFLLARYADNRQRSVLGPVIVVLGLALVYGLVLSTQVEIAIG
jgi:hypothetical protein